MNNKIPLLGMTLAELKSVASEIGMPSYSAKQMADWLYKKKIKTIEEMTNIAATKRQALSEKYEVGMVAPVDFQKSIDGTIKYLYTAGTGNFVESVYIPTDDRATLCVSSQVGCKMNCLFCMTGKQGFHGNLTAHEIINQVLSIPQADQLTNVVFMGMGEPLDNVDNVLRATEALTAPWGYAWSPKRITVSTVGLKSKLRRFIEESECHLAVSLHSPLHEQRAALMPAEKAMPAADIVELLRGYDFSHQRRLSFEYIVFGGLNDSPLHAREIVRLLKGLDCRVNLIRFHSIPGVDLHGADEARIEALRDYLTGHGIFTTIRASRGQDIYAACGLLSTARKDAGTRA